MVEEEKSVSGKEKVEEPSTADSNYLSAINDLKKQMSKLEADNEQLSARNKELLGNVVNGRQQEDEDVKQEVMYSDDEIKKLREDLFSGEELTNLEYAKKALKLREAVLQRGGDDIFAPHGQKISPTQEDNYRAAQTAETLKELIDEAEGNSEFFTNELQRTMRR